MQQTDGRHLEAQHNISPLGTQNNNFFTDSPLNGATCVAVKCNISSTYSNTWNKNIMEGNGVDVLQLDGTKLKEQLLNFLCKVLVHHHL